MKVTKKDAHVSARRHHTAILMGFWIEAMRRMVQQEDVMRSDRLKQVMQDIDPSFDEKDLGFSKFSRFCQEAASRGLLTLTRMENGQYEVGAVGAGTEPAAPAARGRGGGPPAGGRK